VTWLACAESGIGKENIHRTKGYFDLFHDGLNAAFDSETARNAHPGYDRVTEITMQKTL
jgi:hypothetical protein